MEFQGFSWYELVQFWNLQVDYLEEPEYDGEHPEIGKMKDYPADGGYSWSDWWEHEVSDAYKDHLDEFGKVSDTNELRELIAIKDYLYNSFRNKTSEQVANELREFIKVLHKESDGLNYYSPVWNSLLLIEDNETLFKVTVALLPQMWT